jgi:short-subunit dehydrogenase
MHNSLRNSTVVITGASSGIGKAAALAFAQQGANLVLGARRDEPLFEVAEEAQRFGIHALAVPSDVTDPDDMRLLASTAANRFGAIDVWINNAGIGLVGPFADVPMDSHRRVIETNLLGGMHGTHAILPYFLDQEYGTLITNISFGAWIAPPYAAAYAASKAGLEAFTQSIRLELEDWPEIHVCDVFPAVIDTPGYQHGGNYMGKELKPGSPILPPERVADAMVSLAKRPRRGVSVGAMAPLTKFMHTLAPNLTEELMSRALKRYFRRAAPSRFTHGSLFEPMSEGTGMSGGYRRQSNGNARPFLLAGMAALASIVAAGALARR